ncbi:uncharacterized protein N7483_008369 [Penicillium malachiteum]|uniref:uncharacterized protein n=1 Tax=Penicillium malachiteum TaxID=1324776 RepID=UPI0025475083|nr:uncharacterized protein N7483_008369 [Penicillium malachiteum]KAJ5720435.1 hypothetical protein N7483_008369 [Penicillium malachiteum]
MENNAATTGNYLPSNKITKYADTQLTVQYQTGLDIIGVGAAGQVYNVDDRIVLKACRIYQRPSSEATPRALWDYASEKHHHPNIIEPIHTDHPEGMYIHKYQPLSALTQESQSDRIFRYQDIIRALVHLHGLRIAHSDIRKDNILFDQQGHALLSDFGASCPFGYPNPSYPVLSNGPSETVSGATDRFAMGSLIYELEHGIRSEISMDDRDRLILPQINTGHDGLDSLIENAWCGKFDSTTDMLNHAECLNAVQDSRGPVEHPVSKAELITRITQWRKNREEQHGCILYSIPTESQLQILADGYGWKMGEEMRFLDESSVLPRNEFSGWFYLIAEGLFT